MSYRKFTDRKGAVWQIRDESGSRWVFEPLPGNDEERLAAMPPGHTDDPFELSERELQRLLDGARPSGSTNSSTSTKSTKDWPFKDPPPSAS